MVANRADTLTQQTLCSRNSLSPGWIVNMETDERPRDLQALIETDIPEGRANLESSYVNLERVAAYCETNYFQAKDKRAAFDETRRYTIQSLASVAYQINTLAYGLLTMLDLQAERVGDMHSQINNISQIIDIHKEKVARREIGLLTTNKPLGRQHKIIAPVQQERPQRYQRRPIDFTALDDIGHGVKLAPVAPQPHQAHLMAPPSQASLARTGSTVSGSSGAAGTMSSGSHANMASMLPRPACSTSSGGGPTHYRTPVVPAAVAHGHSAGGSDVYGHHFQGQGGRAQHYAAGLAYAPVPHHHQLQQHAKGSYPNMMGGYSMDRHSSASSAAGSRSNASTITASGGNNIPNPPTALHPMPQYGAMEQSDELPPPPSPQQLGGDLQHSPPLPPPPPEPASVLRSGPVTSSHMPELPVYGTVGTAVRAHAGHLPSWAPPDYIEKVVALYDFEATKLDELSFYENAIIYVLKKNEDGWFEGVCEGVTGLFPGNYVEPCF